MGIAGRHMMYPEDLVVHEGLDEIEQAAARKH
jgi:hypothetical protein